MTDQPSQSQQQETNANLFNPFAAAQHAQADGGESGRSSQDAQHKQDNDEDYDDEEADFAQIGDLVDLPGKDDENDPNRQGQQMVTTAAFRMSTNDDLKKTANWSSSVINHESPSENSNNRLDWSAKPGEIGFKQHRSNKNLVNAKSSDERLPEFGTPNEEDNRNEILPEFGTPSQQSQQQVHQAQTDPSKKGLKLAADRKHVAPKSSSSKIIPASNVTFVNQQARQSNASNKYASPTDNQQPHVKPGASSTYQPGTGLRASKQGSVGGSQSFLYRMQANPAQGLIRSEQVKPNNGLQDSSQRSSGQVEIHPFELAYDASRSNAAGLEQSWDSTDPLQQTFAHMNTSEATGTIPSASQADAVNPFTLQDPPILIEQVSHSPKKQTASQQSNEMPLAAFSPGNVQVDTNHLLMQQMSEGGAFKGMEGNANNGLRKRQTQNEANQLRLSKQQNSAATALRQQRVSLGGSSVNNSNQNGPPNPVKPTRFSDASKKSANQNAVGNAQNQAVYRIKHGQINQMTAAAAQVQSQQPNAYSAMQLDSTGKPVIVGHKNSRDRLVTGTTAAGSSENMFSRSTARRGSAQRQNNSGLAPPQQPQNIQRTQQRQNPLIQSGANLLKPMSSDSQQPTSPTGSASGHHGLPSQNRYPSNNVQNSGVRVAPIIAAQNIKEFQEVFSPNKISMQQQSEGVRSDDVRRLNSQQWQSPQIQLFGSQQQQAVMPGIIHQQANLASPHAASQGPQPGKILQPRMSAGKYQLGGNPFEQAAKLGLIAPDDPRLKQNQNQNLHAPPEEAQNHLSPRSNVAPGSLDSFMRIRLSEDFGQQDYESAMNDPTSPLFNKKAQTAVKGGIKEMISGGYVSGVGEINNASQGRNVGIKYQMSGQQNEAGMGSGLRIPNNIQSAGNPFGSIDNSYSQQRVGPQVDDAQAQALFRKISSQGLMQPSNTNSYPTEFDRYYQTLGQAGRQPQPQPPIEHFPQEPPTQNLQLLKVANSANHILVAGDARNLGLQHNSASRGTESHRGLDSRHSIGQGANASFTSQKWSQGQTASASRPIASKNMPQCFRQQTNKRPHAAAQGAQHARSASMGASGGTQGNPTSSASKRCFSNDSRFVMQAAAQHGHSGLSSAGGIQSSPGYMQGGLGNAPGIAGNLGVHQNLHTAQVNKRTMESNNYNGAQYLGGGGISSFGANSAVAPQTATKNNQHHGRDLQQIHESFPAFELQQNPTSPSAAPQGKPSSQRTWENQDPFKQSM